MVEGKITVLEAPLQESLHDVLGSLYELLLTRYTVPLPGTTGARKGLVATTAVFCTVAAL